MSEKASESSANYVLLTRLADEFAARYRAGERPSLQEYIDRYPDLADDIRELFPAMVEIEQVKEDHEEATERAAAPVSPALQQLGDFRLIREVGKGGMGIVYEAEQVSLGRHVALKVLPRNLLVDSQAKRRFEREAKSAAKLHHTNIVPVFGVGEQDGLPYYVMQFIQGLGLDEVLDELKKLQLGSGKTVTFTRGELRVSHGALSAAHVARSLVTGEFQWKTNGKDEDDVAAAPATVALQEDATAASRHSPALSDSFTLSSSSVVLPSRSRGGSKLRSRKQTYWQSVAMIGVQVADALEYAHKQGVQHRDIKPSNLLLDTQGTVWVTDFGLAKADDQQNLTHTGDVLGTLRYMPPEAFEGRTDVRSDLYSLGLTLYEMLAQRPAFTERDRNRLIKQVTHEEPARLGKLNRTVPRDLETIVHKAIDREPGQRYQTAADLSADLQRFIDDEPIRARRINVSERCWRWCKRNRLVAGLMAAVFVLLATVATVASVGYVQTSLALNREASEHAEAERHRTKAERERGRAESNLYHSLVREAQALRRARGDGYRAEVWQRIEQALQLKTPVRDMAQLRQEAVACMGDFVGLSPTEWADFPADISRVALHPDGRQLAVAMWNGTVLFRRLADDAEITRLPPQLPPIADLAFGPSGDILVTRGVNGSVKVWNQNDEGAWALARALTGSAGIERGSVGVTPDGKQVAALDTRGISVWNLKDGSLVTTLAGSKGEPFRCLAISPDGKWLAAGHRSEGTHCILVWELASRELRHTLLPRLDWVQALAFSPNAQHLACSCNFGAAVYDTQEFHRELVLRGDASVTIAWSPDNQVIALPGTVLGNLRLWNFPANREAAALTSKAKATDTVLFSPDGTRLVAVHSRTIQLWNLAGTPERRALAGHAEGVPGIAFSPDGKRLVSVSKDQTLRLWDPTTGQQLRQLTGFAGHLQAVAFSADGRMLATCDEAGGVRVWRAETLQEVAAPRHDLGKQLWAVGFSPDGSYFAACGERGLAIWRVQPEGADRSPPSLLSAEPVVRQVTKRDAKALCFSPNSKLLAWEEEANGPIAVLHIWDLENAHAYPAPPAQIGWHIHGLVFYPDSKRLSVVDPTGASSVWDITTQKLSFSLSPKQNLERALPQSIVALSSDGRWFAASWGRAVTVWDTQTRQPLFTLPEERSMPWSLAWNPSRDLLAVGTSDGGLVIWSIPEVRSRLAELGLDW